MGIYLDFTVFLISQKSNDLC